MQVEYLGVGITRCWNHYGNTAKFVGKLCEIGQFRASLRKRDRVARRSIQSAIRQSNLCVYEVLPDLLQN